MVSLPVLKLRKLFGLLVQLVKKKITKTMKFDITHIGINQAIDSDFNYEIFGVVNGTHVKSYTNDSQAYAWLLDDSEPEMQEHAVRYCETKLMEAYLEL